MKPLTTTVHWFPFSTLTEQVQALSKRISADLSALLAYQPTVVLAVSGGRSPIALFHELANANIDWSRIIVTLVDERLVPATHPDSNANLVQQHLMSTASAAQATFQPLTASHNNSAPFHYPDVTILGMGEDGHTASLFPGATELAIGLDLSTPAPVITITPPAAPHQRLTLTRAALMHSRCFYLAIQGQKKRTVFMQASQRIDPQLPISYLIQQTEVPLYVYWTA